MCQKAILGIQCRNWNNGMPFFVVGGGGFLLLFFTGIGGGAPRIRVSRFVVNRFSGQSLFQGDVYIKVNVGFPGDLVSELDCWPRTLNKVSEFQKLVIAHRSCINAITDVSFVNLSHRFFCAVLVANARSIPRRDRHSWGPL